MRGTDEIDEIGIRVAGWKYVLDPGNRLTHVTVSATVHYVSFRRCVLTDILPRQWYDPRSSWTSDYSRFLEDVRVWGWGHYQRFPLDCA